MMMNKTLFFILTGVLALLLAADGVLLSLRIAGTITSNIVPYIFLGLTALGAAIYTFIYLGSDSQISTRFGLGAVGAAIHFLGLGKFDFFLSPPIYSNPGNSPI